MIHQITNSNINDTNTMSMQTQSSHNKQIKTFPNSNSKKKLLEIKKKYLDKRNDITPKHTYLSSQNSFFEIGKENNFQSTADLTSNSITKQNLKSTIRSDKKAGTHQQAKLNHTFNSLNKDIFASQEKYLEFKQYEKTLDERIEEIKKKINADKLHTINMQRKNTFNVPLEKFLSLNKISTKANPFLNFLQMLDTKDFYTLLSLNKKIKNNIIKALSFEVKTFIANKFENRSNEIFSNYSFTLGINKINSQSAEIILIAKTQISNKKTLNKTVYLTYSVNFPCDGKEYITNYFTFDVKSSPLYYWIMKEYTTFYHDELNKAYFQPIMQFTLNDFAEFTINIITNKGLMNIRTFRWHKIKLCPVPSDDFLEYSKENCFKREIVDYDIGRYCELELLKGLWNDIEQMEHKQIVVNKINEMFSENFKIKKILFDDVGYYIFKVYLEASHAGEMSTQKGSIGIKLTIFNKKSNISNEVKKNNLIYDRKNELQLHLGDHLIFYLTKNK